MVRKSLLLIAFALVLAFPAVLGAQESTATVPDVTRLSMPQAAALLNANGLNVGRQNNLPWNEASGFAPNTVTEQSLAAGTQTDFGGSVDLTILRPTNAILIYDDNDLTFVNQTGGTIDLAGISFQSVDGNTSTAFPAARWGVNPEHGDCTQIWSVGRREGKGLPECGSVNWMTTNDANEYFWTGSNGATQFRIVQNGIERAVCEVSTAGRCPVFLAGGSVLDDVSQFVYFAYTPDQLVVRNVAQNQWMPLEGLIVRNNFAPNTPGAPVPIGDPNLIASRAGIGDVSRLAPGQCLLFLSSATDSVVPPQPCQVVGALQIDASLIFWGADFGVEGVTDPEARSCPAATADNLTICIMPR